MALTADDKLGKVRELMTTHEIAALVITSSDPHQSEYLAGHWQARQWLSGFTGSAGTVLVTPDQALLWTDFRYWIQARAQIRDSEFRLVKLGEPDVPQVEQWLFENLDPGDRVAMDGNVVSLAQIRKVKKKLDAGNIRLVTDLDLIRDAWPDRPLPPKTRAWDFSTVYAGKSRQDKLGEIRKAMAGYGADRHLMTALDDIAWTYNLRGEDIRSNPVNLAFSIIGPEEALLFMDPAKVDKDLAAQLAGEGIDLRPYGDVAGALKGIPDGQGILLDPENTAFSLFNAVNSNCRIIEKTGPAQELKAIKNEIEIRHTRETAVKDGLAVTNFLFWLEHWDGPVSEISAAEKLREFRQEQPDFQDISFSSIMAQGEHSAICHYSADKESDVPVTDKGMFLTDSGGNYLTGTTDITRTLHMGTPSAREIQDYTLVLKGHISVATALFPRGTKGFQIDTLARQFLWKQGMNFGHGTGHGVGFFLSVHEGPARISPHPVDVELKPGMVLTNEPGLYREGQYGIRLENMVLVRDSHETEFGRFLKFENLTLCHFEAKLMDKERLTREEIDWVNIYHENVYEKLSPGLQPEVREWLKGKTLKIN
ncbi:aminopeptidase P family protein [Desulfospira joergensenii]|uniref:aminopeptidase P family protein n=1 Tax=Desulfospira joergensenii TaxID=53329 RepID=UPI0003B37574|nr:aminopeptidase P family protein [Desulfospira joergensenii]